ncbi:MAG: PepSY-associated TM helix domain-containing protein [Bacteroidota bacterium]
MKFITKKNLFGIHGWLGLNIGLLLFVICISGTFATLSNEIDWLLNPEIRVKEKEAPIAWDAMYTNLVQAYPTGQIITLMEQKNSFTEVGDYFAAAALVREPSGELLKVHIDPYTGSIKGDSPFLDVQRFFRSYHNNFFDGSRGVYVVTLTSLFLLCSVFSGFLFYSSWLKNLFKLRLKKGVKVLFADAHKMAGIWSLLFALLIAVTGIWYLAETLISKAGRHKELLQIPRPENMKRAELENFDHSPELLSMDSYVARAQNEFEGFRVEEIVLPQKPDEYVVMTGQDGNPFTRDRTNSVYAHPFTGEVVYIGKAGELSLPRLINNMVDPLHFGTFGGLGIKLLWFLFGLILSFSVLAGTYVWYLRQSTKLIGQMERRSIPGKQDQSEKNSKLKVAGLSLKSLGWARGAVVSSGIILIYLVATGTATVKDGFRIWSGYPKGYTMTINTLALGPWNLDFQCDYPCQLKEGTVVKGRFKSNTLPNYDSLVLQATNHQGATLRSVFKGASALPKLTLGKKWTAFDVEHIEVLVKDYQGNTWRNQISPQKIKLLSEKMGTRFPKVPEKEYPVASNTVYGTASFFGLLVSAIIILWTVLIVKTAIKQQRLLGLSRK